MCFQMPVVSHKPTRKCPWWKDTLCCTEIRQCESRAGILCHCGQLCQNKMSGCTSKRSAANSRECSLSSGTEMRVPYRYFMMSSMSSTSTSLISTHALLLSDMSDCTSQHIVTYASLHHHIFGQALKHFAAEQAENAANPHGQVEAPIQVFYNQLHVSSSTSLISTHALLLSDMSDCMSQHAVKMHPATQCGRSCLHAAWYTAEH